MFNYPEVANGMQFLRFLGICALVAGLTQCRKKSEAVEKEMREAGYEMTSEGWFGAIKADEVSVLKKMVDGGFDEKTKDADGNSGLHAAVAAGSKETGEYLLNRGFSVDLKDAKGRTPLMSAVLADQPGMVKWLLRQGADPKLKDDEGFMALMLATTGGGKEVVEELAPYHREDLDSALLLASLVGNAGVIDALTNYGASVYARMEDGRTPLMMAAENGHKEAAALLVEIGASRFATMENGDTAYSMAVAAGHGDIAKMIETGFVGDTLALESDEEIAESMDGYLDEFEAEPEETADGDGLVAANDNGETKGVPGEDAEAGQDGGEVVSNETQGADAQRGTGGVPNTEGAEEGITGNIEPVENGARSYRTITMEGARIGKNRAPKTAAANGQTPDEDLPLVMRQYRQRELPVVVEKVSGDVASLKIAGPEVQEVSIRAGEKIPGSDLLVVKVFSRTEQGKLNNNAPIEVGVVEVADSRSGRKQEWIAGMPASGHDPVALVEDSATGRRYLAKPGQKFTSEDGREFIVNDVRPSQLVIEETASGEVTTLRLRGPKG